MKQIPLAVIVGPTGSGKTALSVELAKRLNSEIVSADSMQVYRQMRIATAKPTSEEIAGVPHHLLDLDVYKRQVLFLMYAAGSVRAGRRIF